MDITHTYYKCTQSNRLEKENNYAYKITYINFQSKLCKKKTRMFPKQQSKFMPMNRMHPSISSSNVNLIFGC